MRRAILASVLAMAAFAPGSALSAPPAHATVSAGPRLDFSASEMALALAVARDPDLAAFYGEHELRPVFLGADGAARRAALATVIAEAPRHGIPVTRYAPETLAGPDESLRAELAHARQLSRLLRDLTGGMLEPGRIDPEIKRVPDRSAVPGLMAAFATAEDPASVLRGAAPDHPAYRALQAALAGPKDLAIPVHLPRVPDGLWRPGARDPAIAALRARLVAMGLAPEGADAAFYDPGLAAAVEDFQRLAGLPPDGVAGPRTLAALNGDAAGGQDGRQRAIIVALERLRWMGEADLSARHVWVNIPEFSTTIVEAGSEVFRTRSVVGKDTPEMRTPEFSEMMSNVVVNPSWNVPRSIAVRDYLPKLKANRHALAHLDVVDRAGRVLARDGIDFSAYSNSSFPFRLRQKPSDDNALGVVKFIFPNPWNIYLHDTPSKSLFGNRVRAASNGCIRIGDPVDLAHALLSRQTSDPAAMFQRARASGRETWLKLTPAVPVHLVYFTAWPDQAGQVRVHDDIYDRDAVLWQAIQQAGRPSAPSELVAAIPAAP